MHSTHHAVEQLRTHTGSTITLAEWKAEVTTRQGQPSGQPTIENWTEVPSLGTALTEAAQVGLLESGWCTGLSEYFYRLNWLKCISVWARIRIRWVRSGSIGSWIWLSALPMPPTEATQLGTLGSEQCAGLGEYLYRWNELKWCTGEHLGQIPM
jgi:hypothetical protein